MFILRKFLDFVGFGLFLFGVFWLPKDIADWKDAASPWKDMLSMVDQNTALWIFSLSALVYIAWMDVKPFVRRWMDEKRGTPLEVIFDHSNHLARFWSLEQATTPQGKPHSYWEYRVLIRNRSSKTVKNITATVEAIGQFPKRPEASIFDRSGSECISLNPNQEVLAVVVRWHFPAVMEGDATGSNYGPIKMVVSAEGIQPVTRLFSFVPSETPMIVDITDEPRLIQSHPYTAGRTQR